MALTSVGVLGTLRHTDLLSDASVEQVAAASIVVYAIEIDNSGNSSEIFLKLWNLAGSITVGTTDPDECFHVGAGKGRTIAYGVGTGKTFGTGLGIACVTTAGTAGATGPTNPVKVHLITS